MKPLFHDFKAGQLVELSVEFGGTLVERTVMEKAVEK